MKISKMFMKMWACINTLNSSINVECYRMYFTEFLCKRAVNHILYVLEVDVQTYLNIAQVNKEIGVL